METQFYPVEEYVSTKTFYYCGRKKRMARELHLPEKAQFQNSFYRKRERLCRRGAIIKSATKKIKHYLGRRKYVYFPRKKKDDQS